MRENQQMSSEEEFSTRVRCLAALNDAEKQVNEALENCVTNKVDLINFLSTRQHLTELVNPFISQLDSRIRELRRMLEYINMMRERCPRF